VGSGNIVAAGFSPRFVMRPMRAFVRMYMRVSGDCDKRYDGDVDFEIHFGVPLVVFRLLW
jgi:hypothetical protein